MPMMEGLFEKHDGPLFTLAQREDGLWALFFCDRQGNIHTKPFAYVVLTPDGWEICLAEGQRWLPVPEVCEMLRRNGLLGWKGADNDR